MNFKATSLLNLFLFQIFYYYLPLSQIINIILYNMSLDNVPEADPSRARIAQLLENKSKAVW